MGPRARLWMRRDRVMQRRVQSGRGSGEEDEVIRCRIAEQWPREGGMGGNNKVVRCVPRTCKSVDGSDRRTEPDRRDDGTYLPTNARAGGVWQQLAGGRRKGRHRAQGPAEIRTAAGGPGHQVLAGGTAAGWGLAAGWVRLVVWCGVASAIASLSGVACVEGARRQGAPGDNGLLSRPAPGPADRVCPNRASPSLAPVSRCGNGFSVQIGASLLQASAHGCLSTPFSRPFCASGDM